MPPCLADSLEGLRAAVEHDVAVLRLARLQDVHGLAIGCEPATGLEPVACALQERRSAC